jgi:hypothetical protein
VSELLDRIKDQALLLNCELAILAKSIKHDDVFLLHNCKRFDFNLVKLAFFLLKWITSALCLFFPKIKTFIIFVLFFLKCFQFLVYLKLVRD